MRQRSVSALGRDGCTRGLAAGWDPPGRSHSSCVSSYFQQEEPTRRCRGSWTRQWVLWFQSALLLLLLLLLRTTVSATAVPITTTTTRRVSLLARHPTPSLLATTSSSTTRTSTVTQPPAPPQPTWWKSALAGGIAGSVATILLYPLDAAKTLRQAQPSVYPSVWQALLFVTTSNTNNNNKSWQGLATAVTGALPSSALYFGAYETSKRCLLQLQKKEDDTTTSTTTTRNNTWWQRCLLHSTAAAIGNCVSSAVFVPKELLKQQMQYAAAAVGSSTQEQAITLGTVAARVWQQQGWRGFYTGYRATLLRNIPSAALRFVLYEEFKRSLQKQQKQVADSSSSTTTTSSSRVPWQTFIAGAAAGALASGLLTPLDVLKTRLSTGTCPIDLHSCWQTVVQEHGWTALYAGAGSRMLSSAAFSAIGFGTFETVQWWLTTNTNTNTLATPTSLSSSKATKNTETKTNRRSRSPRHARNQPVLSSSNNLSLATTTTTTTSLGGSSRVSVAAGKWNRRRIPSARATTFYHC